MNTITLTYNLWKAEILSDYGMNVISLEDGNKEILRSPRNEEELLKTPFLFGTPLLFPAGRTPDGIFYVDNVAYHLPINEPSRNNHLHGLLHKGKFKIIEQSRTSVTGEYFNDGDCFPIRFSLFVKHTLSDEGLKSEYLFTNTDTKDLPVVFALHTAFNSPDYVEVCIGKKYLLNDRKIAVGLYDEKNEYEEKLSSGLSPAGIPLSGLFELTGPAVIDSYIYRASEPFEFWTVYSGDGLDGYICIEPQCGIGLETDNNRHTKYISPGQSIIFSTSLEKK